MSENIGQRRSKIYLETFSMFIVWEDSASQVIGQNAHVQSDCRILWYSISLEGKHQFEDIHLHEDTHQGKVALEAIVFGCLFPAIPSHARTCLELV